MRAGALAPYEGALRGRGQLNLLTTDGRVVELEIHRYLQDADATDEDVLSRCRPPVLDVGCGPGRIAHALARRGLPALGVDIAEVAVALAVERGAAALTRNVFDPLPGEGRWPTILVLDGNVGIGGDLTTLLARLRNLMAPRGSLIVEANSLGTGVDEVLDVRFGTGDRALGPSFAWAVASVDVLAARAGGAGLLAADYFVRGGRSFVRLERNRAMR